MSDLLCDMLVAFYADIRSDLAESVSNAISAADNADEFEENPAIIASFSQLITSLAFHYDTQAINNFMSDNVTRGSASRPFFHHMTLPLLLYPEETPVYPQGPQALPALARSFTAPSIQVPLGFFDAPICFPDDNEAQAPSVVPR
jgi:hypothetical protein